MVKMMYPKLIAPATLVLVFGTCVFAAIPAGSNTYLPPNKGYNYPTPSIPFPNSTPSRPPSIPSRPTPSYPTPGRPTPSYPTPGRPTPSYPTPGRPTPSYPSRPTPSYPPGPTPPGPGPNTPPHHPPGGNPHDHDHHHHEPGMPFDFAYAVNDINTSNDYSHQAKSDGDVTRGEYRVQLPDGRTQVVRYTADWKTGYHAEVSYEGEARYPEGPSSFGQQNQGYNY